MKRAKKRAMKSVVAGFCLALWAGLLGGEEPLSGPPKAGSPESLRAEIEALKPAKISWREIAWKSCLLDGLRESRRGGKPILLWIFIDRPADDGRC
jgi:hypothetical protein